MWNRVGISKLLIIFTWQVSGKNNAQYISSLRENVVEIGNGILCKMLLSVFFISLYMLLKDNLKTTELAHPIGPRHKGNRGESELVQRE